jgi:hypothetical protein
MAGDVANIKVANFSESACIMEGGGEMAWGQSPGSGKVGRCGGLPRCGDGNPCNRQHKARIRCAAQSLTGACGAHLHWSLKSRGNLQTSPRTPPWGWP